MRYSESRVAAEIASKFTYHSLISLYAAGGWVYYGMPFAMLKFLHVVRDSGFQKVGRFFGGSVSP
jgi:hypothetical protein